MTDETPHYSSLFTSSNASKKLENKENSGTRPDLYKTKSTPPPTTTATGSKNTCSSSHPLRTTYSSKRVAIQAKHVPTIFSLKTTIETLETSKTTLSEFIRSDRKNQLNVNNNFFNSTLNKITQTVTEIENNTSSEIKAIATTAKSALEKIPPIPDNQANSTETIKERAMRTKEIVDTLLQEYYKYIQKNTKEEPTPRSNSPCCGCF